LGLTAGLVPPRVDGTVKAGLLDLVEHAMTVGGWSLRRAAATLANAPTPSRPDKVLLAGRTRRAGLARHPSAAPVYPPETPVHG